MLKAFAKAIAQFDDPALRAVLWKSILIAGVLSALLYALTVMLLSGVDWGQLPVIGTLLGWFGDIETIAVTAFWMFTVGLLLWFLFPPMIIAVTGLFLEQVCAAVDARHYPNAPPPRSLPYSAALGGAVKFLLLTLLINALALPFYILAFWVAGLGLLLYYLVNGYLFGREYFQFVADRRWPPQQAARLYRVNRGKIMLAGCLTAFGMSIPLLNLATPLLAAAAMTHIAVDMDPLTAGKSHV